MPAPPQMSAEEYEQLIGTLMSPDNASRSAAEAHYNQAKENTPLQLLTSLATIMRQSQQEQLRAFAASCSAGPRQSSGRVSRWTTRLAKQSSDCYSSSSLELSLSLLDCTKRWRGEAQFIAGIHEFDEVLEFDQVSRAPRSLAFKVNHRQSHHQSALLRPCGSGHWTRRGMPAKPPQGFRRTWLRAWHTARQR